VENVAEVFSRLLDAGRIGFQNCENPFAAALAKREKAAIYTGDPEFKTIKVVCL
jgi:hypothetical protein